MWKTALKATILRLIKEISQTLKTAGIEAVQAVLISPCFASTACYGQTVFSEINWVVKSNVLALSAQPGFVSV